MLWANAFVGAEDDIVMRVQQVVALTGHMPLDFPKSAALDMCARGLPPGLSGRSLEPSQSALVS